MQALFKWVLLILMLPLSLSVRAQARTARPNIIVMMADDLDSRQLSCYGGTNLTTTNIDLLASQGLQFNQMIASEAMCVPTRASLFTGLYPARHGSFQNHKPVFDGLKSINHYLKDLNYTVALTGKNHSTRPASVFPFQFIKGFEPNCVARSDEYFLDSVKQFITSQKDPYCLFVMSINPHAPWNLGDPGEFEASKLKLPPHWVDTKEVREQFRKYLAEVRRLDDQVGDIMKLLEQTGQDKNTIFIFLGEQGAQFPGAKWTLWDQGQKSSMIIRWPGVVQPGSKTDALVQYEDLTPTFIDIAGGQPVASLDGKSFLNVIKGKTGKARDFAYGIHSNIPEGPPYPIRSVRTADYKLILNLLPGKNYHIKYMMNPGKKDSYWNGWVAKAADNITDQRLINRIVHRPEAEFYDLEKDPYELHNLVNEPRYKSLVEAYRLALKKWMQQQGDTGVEMDTNYKKTGI